MKELRILLTGVGRRIELLQAFRQAALAMQINLKLFGADASKTAPALAYCDAAFPVCGMKEPDYIPQLVKLCRENRVDLVIPTIDTDLLVLSRNTAAFGETKVLISAPDKIEICRDKRLTAEFLLSCGCKAPETVDDYRQYKGPFPCFIKPLDGSSSINAYTVRNAEELKTYAEKIGGYIVQPFIAGTEYTVDIFCTPDGEPIFITPRIRLAVRSGEVLKTQIAMDDKIIGECRQLLRLFRPVGPITVQLIRETATGEDWFIEINPRFGGGAPLSMKAGARSAEAVLKLLLGEPVNRQPQIDDGAIFSRFDQSIRICDGARKQPVRGIVFDLDDTLYSEKQYVRSGFSAVADYLDLPEAAELLWQLFLEGKPAIDTLLSRLGRAEQAEDCLHIYRTHTPTMTLEPGISERLSALRQKGIRLGIITDGRPFGQRRKLAALGLEPLVDDIIVTDELGGEQFRKPCDIAFRILQRKWRIPFEQLLYVGDNQQKDPQAPIQLGMRWMPVNNGDGLYAQENKGRPLTEILDSLAAEWRAQA